MTEADMLTEFTTYATNAPPSKKTKQRSKNPAALAKTAFKKMIKEGLIIEIN
jgi:hypothetical protein